jgi:hypothetical protein
MVPKKFFSTSHGKEMKPHPEIKPAIWGAVAGALVMAIVGFWALGWTLASSADRMARDRSEAAVVDALTPACVARFEAQADVADKLTELKKISMSWDQRSFIEKGGWATTPGSDAPNSEVATACAEKLGKAT